MEPKSSVMKGTNKCCMKYKKRELNNSLLLQIKFDIYLSI